MNLKVTKRPIMGFAAILILIFHFFPISWQKNGITEITNFITLISYIGVDIFLFTTGYMLYYSDTSNYFKYIKRKTSKLYILFVLFSLINLFINNLSILSFFKTIFGIDLFIKGGTSFLWFIPAIIIVYLLAPLFTNVIKKYNGKIKYIIILLIWLIVVMLLELLIKNNSINIFLCRIPIIVIGTYFVEFDIKKYKTYFMFLLLIVGFFLIYEYGYISKLNYPIESFFYITAIPFIIGIILFLDIILSKYKSNVLEFLGSITLELYSLQMLFGQMIFESIYKLFNDKYYSFFIVSLILIFLSYLLKLLVTELSKKDS